MSTLLDSPLPLDGGVPNPTPLARLLALATELLAVSRVHLQLDEDAAVPEGGVEAAAPEGPWAGAISELCARAMAERRALVVPDLGARGPGALLAVPLPADGSGRPPGCLCAFQPTARIWSAVDQEHLASVAALVSGEVQRARESGERRALENVLRVLGTALEHMQLGVTVTGLDGRIIYTNPAEAAMHGYEVEELVGQHARILGPPELCREANREWLGKARSWTRESANVRRDGSRFPVLLWSDCVTDAEGNWLGVVTCCEDITERKRSEQALRDVALRDPLTGLPNRVHFLERLTLAIQRVRCGHEEQFAVLFLDLDRFKVVNDSLGHHVGDELLVSVASRLRNCLRPGDTVARFGGDEFAVLLESIESSPDDALQVAERIQRELAAPIQLNGYELFTSASIGIVLSSPTMNQPEYVWRSADMAMYRAKGAGTGRYEVFDRAMHADALARLQLETDLRRAVERSEFRLHYQPVVELASGKIVGFEALLRWEHPLRGLVSPLDFIPAAEEMGLILPMGEWVLREACRRVAAWGAIHGESLWIGVNLSGKQLSQPGLVETVQHALRESGVPPRCIKLEITESAVVEDSQHAVGVLQSLKALGVQLFMDDFGTGYSSLSYLHRLPLDALKIDRSFVNQMEPGNKHSRLVATIVSLAQGVGLGVVAEGVSTPDQLHALQEHGCEFGQGFLFSPPLPAAQAEMLLRSPPAW